MLEDIADPAESLLSSPDLGGNDSKTGSSHHDETLCGAYVTTVLEICLYLLVYYVAFNSLANRYISEQINTLFAILKKNIDFT